MKTRGEFVRYKRNCGPATGMGAQSVLLAETAACCVPSAVTCAAAAIFA